MKRLPRLAILVGLAPLVSASSVAGAINVVATTEDLASLAREVGGDKIKVEALARGYQDPHFVEAKPSFIRKLGSADLLLAVGKELEIGWLPPLVQQSRNARIQPGADGYLDASLTVKILDVPQGPITRAMGDVHPTGNPHYWLDPDNGRRVAQAIRDKLAKMSPPDADYFGSRFLDFGKRLADAQKRWDGLLSPYRGLKVVTYHRSWPNFCDRFGLDVVGYVEPRPGIPPSPAHTLKLIAEMKRLGVKILLVEPYFDLKTPQSIGRETGAKVVVLLPSVGGEKQVTDYIQLFDYDIGLLVGAIREVGAR
jgi:zinc/manganese transport system substrate-binding protein